MCSTDADPSNPLSGHAIIAGFGVPGRAVADVLNGAEVPFCVIELNRQTVDRCVHRGVHIIEGDVCDEQTLKRAGVERSILLVLAVPSDAAVLEAIRVARRLNSQVRIIARLRFISAGLEAHRLGADEVIVEEQAVAAEMADLVKNSMPPASIPNLDRRKITSTPRV